MPDRHWIIAYNSLTQDYVMLKLVEEWITFKYIRCIDMQPDWLQISFYKSQEDACSALLTFQNKIKPTAESSGYRKYLCQA